jgi:PAS domain S-box-containing protein
MFRYALPINAGNRLVGVMVAGTTKGLYSDEEKVLMHAVAEVLGNSLTNAKLYNLTRRALDTTKKTQGYLESFIREARMGVLVLDERGAVMIINQEAERFLGVQQRDIMGQNAMDMLRGRQGRGQQMIQGFQSCFKEKLGVQYTEPVYDESDSQTVLINVFPLFREKGELIGAAATITRA